MTLLLDHIVIGVADLEQAIANYTALGFTVQRGGIHADGATHNALVGFADGSYLELIAFRREVAGRRWWELQRRDGEGFVDYALLPGRVGEVVTRARRLGLDYTGPVSGGRLRPDGVQLQWQIGLPPSHDLPFLCGDLTPRTGRVPEGAVRVHGNGITGVAALTVAVQDLDASLARYVALLGPEALRQPATPLPGAGLRLASLALGPTRLLLLGPGPGDSAVTASLHERLQRRGEGLLGVALATPAGSAAARLAPSRCHGAWFETLPTEGEAPR